MQASIILTVPPGTQVNQLERTLQSVLLATPASTLHELIVVNSTGEELDLAAYPVRVLTTETGLPRAQARNQAAHLAKGEVLAFLPALARPMDDWIVPLLHALRADPRAVLSPVLHGLDQGLWAAGPATVHKYGWRWDLTLHRALDESYEWAVTLPGDCLTLTKALFLDLGGFDEAAAECEELEFCTKSWLCGSLVRPVPAARVAVPLAQAQPSVRTAARVAETWLGPARHRFYDARGLPRGSVETGNLAPLVGVQERLQARDANWLVDTFQPELGRVYELQGRYAGKSVAIVADGPSLDHVQHWELFRHDLRIGLDYAATLFECELALALGREPVRALLLSGKYQQSQLVVPATLVGPDGVANVVAREVVPRATVFELAEPGAELTRLEPPLANYAHSLHAAVHLAAFLGASRVTLYGWDGRLVNGRSHTSLIPHYGGGEYLADSPTTRSRYEFYARGLDALRALLSNYNVPLLRYGYA